MIRKLYRKIIYGHRASSETYIEFLRSRGAKIGEGCILHTPTKIIIDNNYAHFISFGNKVQITQDCIILAHDNAYSVLENVEEENVQPCLRPQRYTRIGNNVFIGMKSVVLMGADIGDNVIIGAGSVVIGRVEGNSVYAGVPARKICSIEEYKEKLKKGFVESSAIWAESLKKKKGCTPDPQELIMYSTVLQGHEFDIQGRNEDILKDVQKFKSVEDLINSLNE